MISTDHQLAVAKEWLAKFMHNVTVLSERAETNALAAFQLQSARSSVTDIEREIAEYEALVAGEVRDFEVGTLDDLPLVLVKARIARKLSQSDLAELLGVKPQQVQRWESQGYEKAAFSTLARIASLLGVRLPARVELHGDDAPVPISKLKRQLIRTGMPQEVVEKRLLPHGIEAIFDAVKFDEVDARFERLFGWNAAALAAGRVEFPRSELAFKLPASAAQDRTRAYAAYISGLCRIVGSAMPPAQRVTTSWQKTRQEIFPGNAIDLAKAIESCWRMNIAVVPVQDAVAFDGAFWTENGRTVVVLACSSEEESRWLLALLHELFHQASKPDAHGLAAIALDETSAARRQSVEERRAHMFAALIATDGRYDALMTEIVDKARGQTPALKTATIDVAKRSGVPLGVLANLLAWRLQEERTNWWPIAKGLQGGRNDGPSIVRRAFTKHFPINALQRMERDIVVQALEADYE